MIDSGLLNSDFFRYSFRFGTQGLPHKPLPACQSLFLFKRSDLKPVADFDERLHELILAAFREDVGDGDHSSLAIIPADAKGKAVLKIKQDGVLAGVDIARHIFLQREPNAVFIPLKEDGQEMTAGEEAFTIQASVHTLLVCERVVLNCMQRMSGIATLTRQFVDAISGYSSRILDTRKTTPNFRILEKEAVRIGWGMNHRFGLFDMIMLKDNHIDFCGGIVKALDRAREYSSRYKKALRIEIEVRSLKEVEEVLNSGKADRILLDNFNPELLKKALILVQGRLETEASGGINLDNVREYAATGVDFISIGALIHQARSLDLSLKAV